MLYYCRYGTGTACLESFTLIFTVTGDIAGRHRARQIEDTRRKVLSRKLVTPILSKGLK